jgi:hypothetical protein
LFYTNTVITWQIIQNIAKLEDRNKNLLSGGKPQANLTKIPTLAANTPD